ncbi:hypothetical protein [Desertimonas flava]|uniref:hypothetical protein n=1 Tax=Desertimonas flava TaxID=2064846 RepID=UPI0023F3AC2D|nr:hypothetical protein [Desertimonas flava]
MIQLAGMVIGMAVMAGSAVAPAAAADQSSADAAIDAFTQRMTDLGFVATPDDDDDDDDDADIDDTDIDDPDGDDASDPFEDCLAGSGIVVPDDPDAPMPGTTAEAESPELDFTPGGEPEPTEMFDFSPTIPESIVARVTTVDETGVELMSQLVDWMGSKDAAACFEESLVGDMLETEGDDELDMDIPPPEIEMSNSADIGVGDRSARIDMSFSMTFIVQIDMDLTMLFAQSDRSMVMVMHATGDDGPTSGVDPIAELQTIVDDLSG